MRTIRYVEAETVRLERPEGAIHLRVHLDDLCVRSAVVKRVFPLSVPSKYLAILTSAGDEVAILKDAEGLDPASKSILDEEVDRRYFTPTISRIELLRQEAGMWHFDVQTQRGQAEFYVRNWRDSAQEIAAGRWQIHTVDGARYEILNLEQLDARSRRFLDQLL